MNAAPMNTPKKATPDAGDAGGQAGEANNTNNSVTISSAPVPVSGWVDQPPQRPERFSYWCEPCRTWHCNGWNPDIMTRFREAKCKGDGEQILMVRMPPPDFDIPALLNSDSPPPGARDPGPIMGRAEIVRRLTEVHDYIAEDLASSTCDSGSVRRRLEIEYTIVTVWRSLGGHMGEQIRENDFDLAVSDAQRIINKTGGFPPSWAEIL